MPEYANASKRLATLPEGGWKSIPIPLRVSDQEMTLSLKATIDMMADAIGPVSVELLAATPLEHDLTALAAHTWAKVNVDVDPMVYMLGVLSTTRLATS